MDGDEIVCDVVEWNSQGEGVIQWLDFINVAKFCGLYVNMANNVRFFVNMVINVRVFLSLWQRMYGSLSKW